MKYLFNRGTQFSYRVLARILGISKSDIQTLLTATEPVGEIVVEGKRVFLDDGFMPLRLCGLT